MVIASSPANHIAIAIALILALFFIVSPSSSSSSSSSFTGLGLGLVVEEKARLGSTPPSCEKRCNMCHPCMAVQVPTTPSRRRVDPSSDIGDDENRYSNYKPLGWKCRCQGNLYNP